MRTALVLTAILLCTPPGFADVIYLKNGKRVVADRVWEEGDQIRCELFGSVIGYPKEAVERIESDTSVKKSRSTFKFDLWRSGTDLKSLYRIASRNDIPLRWRGEKAGDREHFDPAIEQTGEGRSDLLYSETLLGYPATVQLTITPTSRKLASVAIRWFLPDNEARRDLVEDVSLILSDKYEGPDAGAPSQPADSRVWQINDACRATLRTRKETIFLTYRDDMMVELAAGEREEIRRLRRQEHIRKGRDKY